jgi:acyl-CoA thioester hydrolase
VYYDWGALSRIEFLYAHGLTAAVMQQLHFGPILFREECVFRKEIRLGDKVTIGLKLLKAKKDFSRWSIQHDIVKNDTIISAILTVDGAWIDTVQRKLAQPPEQVTTVFSAMPKGESFQWIE